MTFKILNPGCGPERSPACYGNLCVPPGTALSPVLLGLTVVEVEGTLEVIRHRGRQTVSFGLTLAQHPFLSITSY